MTKFYVEKDCIWKSEFDTLYDACTHISCNTFAVNQRHIAIGIEGEGLIFRSAPHLAPNEVYCRCVSQYVAFFSNTSEFVNGIRHNARYRELILDRKLNLYRVDINFNRSTYCYQTILNYMKTVPRHVSIVRECAFGILAQPKQLIVNWQQEGF